MAKRRSRSQAPAPEPPAPEARRTVLGTLAGDATVEAASAAAAALWKQGDLQKTGRDLLSGRVGLRAALGSAAGAVLRLVRSAQSAHQAVAEEERRANRELDEALRRRHAETGARTGPRGGKNDTVVQGLVADAEGQALPGVVVEAHRVGTQRETVLAVDVTDAKGRYRLVIPASALGTAEAPKATLRAGLDRRTLLFQHSKPVTLRPGGATDQDLLLPPEVAERARHGLAVRGELDLERLHALRHEVVLGDLQGRLISDLAEILEAGLGRARKGGR